MKQTYIYILIASVVIVAAIGIAIGRSSRPIVFIEPENEGSFLRLSDGATSSDSLLSNALIAARKKRDGGGGSIGTSVSTTSIATTSVTDSFEEALVIEETNSPSLSVSPRWWVNSGAYFSVGNGVGRTVQGNLPSSNRWFTVYNQSNPVDTDNGAHPQNIFRLVEVNLWQNLRQSVYFKITNTNFSSSPNRNASNGVLLFNRYQSGDNLYYVGIRVDGAVVIKKKYQGVYYTLAYKKILPGTYDRTSPTILIPQNMWYGLRSEVFNNADGSATIRLYTDQGRTGIWTLQLEVKDVPGVNGSAVISTDGFAGIRTDFMDVEFDDYQVAAK